MRRTLLQRRNALLAYRGSRLGVFVLVIAAILVLARLFVPSFLLALTAPLYRAGGAIAGANNTFLNGFASTAKLGQERAALLTANATLEEENAVLTHKVEDLTQLLGSQPRAQGGVIAAVLARPPEAAYDTLIVAAGSSAGVLHGDIAYTEGGIPVGVVDAVAGESARVTLFSAAAMVTPAWLGPMHTPIELRGEGGGAFSAAAPRGATSTVGELVSTLGDTPIATVRGETGDPSATIASLQIAGLVNIFSISDVLLKHVGSASWPRGAPTATSSAL